jgi:hypothetical protein
VRDWAGSPATPPVRVSALSETRRTEGPPLFNGQPTLHVLVPHSAKVRALEREVSTLICRELHRHRLSLWHLSLNMELVQFKSMLCVKRRNSQPNAVPTFYFDNAWRELELLSRYCELLNAVRWRSLSGYDISSCPRLKACAIWAVCSSYYDREELSSTSRAPCRLCVNCSTWFHTRFNQ